MSIEGAQSYVTYTQLGGNPVAIEQFCGEVARWPLDGILGFLGHVSLEATKAGATFTDPRWQGVYLSRAIADDFPRTLPRAGEMYAPGRVPYTRGRHMLVHEHNLALLAHVALLHAKEDAITLELDEELVRRMCRLLLIASDLLSAGSTSVPTSLSDRRAFVLNWFRQGQFNRFFEPSPMTLLELARQHIMLRHFLPNYFPAVEALFAEATNGIDLQTYLEILVLFTTHVHHQMSNGWLNEETLFAALAHGREDAERIFSKWIRTPGEYRESFRDWTNHRPTEGYRAFYDFVCLRESPMIKIAARTNELVCPVVPFLLAKVVDGPYFILSDHLRGTEDFQTALGRAYQEYAHGLVDRISRRDRQGVWQVEYCPRTADAEELTDSYLQRGEVAFAFEHKGLRPGTDFLRGGPGDRVLGPSDFILERLDSGHRVTVNEGLREDNGLFTRAVWQQSRVGGLLPAWAEHELGVRPQRVFPVITHLADLRADDVSRRGYLEPLMHSAGLYAEELWERPQWLHVSDLEGLAALAERGHLDLQALFQEKNQRFPHQRFEIFLHNRFKISERIDSVLLQDAKALIESARHRFWQPNSSS